MIVLSDSPSRRISPRIMNRHILKSRQFEDSDKLNCGARIIGFVGARNIGHVGALSLPNNSYDRSVIVILIEFYILFTIHLYVFIITIGNIM